MDPTQRSHIEDHAYLSDLFEEQEFIIEMLPAVWVRCLSVSFGAGGAFVHGREPYLFRKDLPCLRVALAFQKGPWGRGSAVRVALTFQKGPVHSVSSLNFSERAYRWHR